MTAAMPDGTGLSKFEKALPSQYFDTGICESHLVAMAAGMAKSGLRPIAAVYSTFMQRAFDQVWQEVILNKLPVVFCMDRAGLVGDDGAVHHGFIDQSFLRPLPDIVLMAPSDEAELGKMLRLGLTLDHASAIRYPRDVVPSVNYHQSVAPELQNQATQFGLGKSRTLRIGSDVTIIAYGSLVEAAMQTAQLLASIGPADQTGSEPQADPRSAYEIEHEGSISVEVIDARFCKPLDADMLARVLRPGHAVITLEDHIVTGGFGSAVLEHARTHGLPTQHLTILGHPADRLIAHAKRAEQLAEVGLNAAGIARAVRRAAMSTLQRRSDFAASV